MFKLLFNNFKSVILLEDAKRTTIRLMQTQAAISETALPDEETDSRSTKFRGQFIKENRARKYSLLVAYSGEGYYGLQRNPDFDGTIPKNVRSIEDEVIDGLVKLKCIRPEYSMWMDEVNFQRAARTDKGVSAAANLIGLTMVPCDNLVEKLNDIMPKQIRVLDLIKVTPKFCPKGDCIGRTYSYTLPTYAFTPINEAVNVDYRISDEKIAYINKVLVRFTGVHNYHNFTKGFKYVDPRVKRTMHELECGKPFLHENMEFVTIKIRGNSFILYQIRNMIGLLISVVRGLANEDLFDVCWSPYKVSFPTAPPVGLMLERLHYDVYNRIFASGKGANFPSLDWKRYEPEIDKFKKEQIFPKMLEKEVKEYSMMKWMSNMLLYDYDITYPNRDYHFARSGIRQAMYNIDYCDRLNLNTIECSEDAEERLKIAHAYRLKKWNDKFVSKYINKEDDDPQDDNDEKS